MTAIFEPVRLAQRTQLELYHGQETFFDDPPVLIRATSLPVARLSVSALFPSADLRPAEHPDPRTDGRSFALTACQTDSDQGVTGRGSALTHDNAVSAQNLSLGRALTADRSLS